MTSPLNVGVDGKFWAQNNGFAGVHRIDLKTGQWETWEPFKEAPVGHNIYDVISDSKNNAWFTDIGRETIGRIDAITKQVTMYDTPTRVRDRGAAPWTRKTASGSRSIGRTVSACST